MITQLSLGCVWISVGHPRILIEVGFGLRRGESQTKKVCDFSIFAQGSKPLLGLDVFGLSPFPRCQKASQGKLLTHAVLQVVET